MQRLKLPKIVNHYSFDKEEEWKNRISRFFLLSYNWKLSFVISYYIISFIIEFQSIDKWL